LKESVLSIAFNFFKMRYIPWMDIRPSTNFLMDHFISGSDLVGVEIGTQYGYNAYNILSNMSNVSKLFLIDPYESYSDYGESWASSDGVDCALVKAKKCLSKFDDRIVFVKKFSDVAVSVIPDDVDFVYVDGNHDYDFVRRDLMLYYPKIKSGGVLCGHDFATYELGVCRAVVEFCNKHNLVLYGGRHCWWVVKK